MTIFYDLIFLIYACLYLPYLGLTQRGYSGYAMRFGIFPKAIKELISRRPNVWMHAVSVGEVTVLEGMIKSFKEKYPQYQIIVTVTTKTGYALAQQRLVNQAVIIPSPLDFSFVAAYFIRLIKPQMYLVAETELWPNLFGQLQCRAIPIVIINGRISDNSLGRYRAIRWLLRGILKQVSVFCMQSQRDAERIKSLGAEESKVHVTGNVKFDDLPMARLDAHADLATLQGQLLWIAGSTHPGEEEIVLDVYAKVIAQYSQWRLIIAPRHVERASAIINLIESRGHKAIRFSELSFKSFDPDAVIVVDTIGHLRTLYAWGSLIFVGKSLTVAGGHNVIEPAFFSKAIIIGPHVENFRDIVACFKDAQALVQVADEQSFEMVVLDLVGDEQKRNELGQRAQKVIAVNQGATARSLDLMKGFLK